jgi:sulfur carrier protein
VKVRVNGEDRDVPAGTTVAEVVRSLGAGPGRGVAVALDGEVLPRGEWEAAALGDGQHVEVLRAVAGG